MSSAAIVGRAAASGVRLVRHDDRIRMIGPRQAVDAIRAEIIAHKAEIMALLRAAECDATEHGGALSGPPAGTFWPWCPDISAEDLPGLYAELAGLIRALSALEHWPREDFSAIMTRAMRQPVAALLPDLHYFRQRLAGANDEIAARADVAAWCWRYDPAKR
jgi:hypothetical protein